nr:histidine--tRNA ligase [bacterium]
MANYQAPKGTQDVLPEVSFTWQWMEKAMRRACALAGYREIRTPVIEHTELFLRGVGDTTDIVQKEMYTFEDKGGRSITLKPEGTAGAVRALIQSGALAGTLPQKAYYLFSPTFRYEKPQAGRLREHHQFGVEVFGAAGPSIDAEIISLAYNLFVGFGVKNLKAQINSIGCPTCRSAYYERLRAFLGSRLDRLCDACRDRFERNPLRILDCKEAGCQAALEGVPEMVDCLCPECAAHFNGLQQSLTALEVPFEINPRIVRGLDYYTRTVFEIVSDQLGAQATVCGGGRYDGLVEQLGGPSMPGIGFGMGMERLYLMLDALGLLPKVPPAIDVFIACVDSTAGLEALKLAKALRAAGIRCDVEHTGRGLKAQFKYAGRMGCRFVCVLGPDELAEGKVVIRDMAAHEEQKVELCHCAGWLMQKQAGLEVEG